MMPPAKPDFFLVGAPKCGTTAVFTYLRDHPDVFMCRKERHYFGRDLRPDGYEGPHGRDLDWYLDYFAERGTARRAGDASVWYLRSETAAEEIHAFNPDADIVVMLRDPVEMMYSLYNMFMWVRDPAPGGVLDPVTRSPLSFEDALRTQDERRAAFLADPGDEVRQGLREMRLFHTEAAMYSRQVARYLDVFGPERVHVILYDDFKRDADAVYRRLLAFLGVDPAHERPADVVNGSRKIRSTKLHWILRTKGAAGPVRQVARALVPEALRKEAWRRLMRFNVKHAPRPPMAAETRAWLRDHFRDDVERLGRLLGEDLTARWTDAGPTFPARP